LSGNRFEEEEYPMLARKKEGFESVTGRLRDPRLFREQAYIGGKWRTTDPCPR